jgi:predicted permease
MNPRDLLLRLRAVFLRRRVERELNEELEFHIEQETRKLVVNGLDPEAARSQAVKRFGSVDRVEEECRDERGTSFIDTTVRDIAYAWRTFKRTPGVALTVVATVSLGLGLVATVFTLLSLLAFRDDAVRDPHQLFAVERASGSGDERRRFTRPDYEALRRETDVFTDVFAMIPDIDSRIDGRMMGGTLVTGNFFQALGREAVLGRALQPKDDERGASAPVIVLSDRGWRRHFDRDPGIVGRTLLVNGRAYEVVGVMPDGFRGLTVGAPDYWAPLAFVGHVRPHHAAREDQVGIEVVGRLKQDLSPRSAAAALSTWLGSRERGTTTTTGSGPLLTLEPRRGALPEPLMEVLLGFSPLFFAFGLILLIGCANVANLLLARAVARQREIGVRLSLGASRGRVIRQLITESLLLASAAAVGGLLLSRFILEATVGALTRTMPSEIAEMISLSAPAADWRVVAFLAVVAVIATASFGWAPALRATRIDVVRTLRGETTSSHRPSRARNLLIAVQVMASAVLLIGAAIFLRSALRSAGLDPGLRTADTLCVEIINHAPRAAIVGATMADPAVQQVAAVWPEPLSPPGWMTVSTTRSSSPGDSETRLRLGGRLVSPEYFGVLDIEVVRGRVFTPEESTSDAAVALISETTARRLWPKTDALGQLLQVELDPPPPPGREDQPPFPWRSVVVIGVARDVPGFRLAGYEEAGVYLPTQPSVFRTSLLARVHGDPDAARRTLLQRLTLIDPNLGQVVTLRTLARLETYMLQIAFWITVALGALALALTLSGLFSVLSYLVEQRSKEIGVRLAIGATSGDVARHVMRQILKPVASGLFAGAAAAGGTTIALMATPLAASIRTSVLVFDPLAYVLSIATIVGACMLAGAVPALRAARIDPIATLRQD